MLAVTRAGMRTWLKSATILAGCFAASAYAQSTEGSYVPSGQIITPTFAPGSVFQDLNPGLPDHPDYRAGQALKTVISPDGSTLLVMTSGYNNLNYSNAANSSDYSYLEPSASQEYVFVYDISGGYAATPLLKQVIKIDDTFVGLVFSPDGTKFYASGGVDDKIYTFTNGSTGWTRTAIVHLGHHPLGGKDYSSFLPGGLGLEQSPSAAGLALSASGNTLVVANIYNDSISVINTQTNMVQYEYDLRPYNTNPSTGNGIAGGEDPFAVAVAGESMVYVSSIRDRQVVVLNIGSGTPQLVTRIALTGNPNSMVFDNPASPTKLYVTQDNSDYVAVINLADNTLIEQIDAIGPAGMTKTAERYTGAAPNNLAIAPNGRTLYVTNGGQNAVAVIPLTGPAPHSVAGLIPSGWYPHAVSVTKHQIYVVNGKSDPGPNPDYCSGSTYDMKGIKYPGGNDAKSNDCYASNEYIFQIEKAGLLSLPIPDASELSTLTARVAANNFYSKPEAASAQQTMADLQQKITHVIYIVKENRTFDQILGDLTNGANGDPTLVQFGRRVTPNFHKIAEGFVTLDNFYDPAEVSGNGWEWSTAARETDINVKQIPLDYASSPAPSAINAGYRGAPYDAEGQNRDIDVGRATLLLREQALPLYATLSSKLPGGTDNLLPGINNDAAPDGPNDARQTGYLWDAAVRGGLTVRNYGYYIDLLPYNIEGLPGYIPPTDPTPYANNDVQAYSTNPTLLGLTDPYFRSFDNNYPDFFRYNEWKREFDNFVTNGDLPNLTFLRFMHDHMGNFGSKAAGAKYGINYPEAQQADDDYAVGLVADAVAKSKYKGNTLIFVIEDDAQDGADHVDAHRSTAYIIGPYVKQKAVVSTFYTTVNMIRTIEDILGLDHLNLNDAYAAPMADVFDLSQSRWNYNAVASPYLYGTADATPGIHYADNLPANPVHTADWWAEQTKGFDWSREDRVPAGLFNHILWKGFFGDKPYPTVRHGASKVSVVEDNDD